MMFISYFWGQKVYPVPYNVPRVARLFGVMLLVYALNEAVIRIVPGFSMHLLSGGVFMLLYLGFVANMEKKNLRRLPVIGNFMK
jgi:hypothetical protein